MPQFKPKDMLAAVVIIGYIFLAWKGLETMITTAAMIIIGYYFARREEPDHTG